MAPGTARTLRNTLLILAVALLIVNLLGMAGKIHKIGDPRAMNVLVLVLVIAARALRRSAKRVRPLPSA